MKIQKNNCFEGRGIGGEGGRGGGGGGGVEDPIRGWGGGGSKVWVRQVMLGMGDVNQE